MARGYEIRKEKEGHPAHRRRKNSGPPNFCMKKIKTSAFQFLLLLLSPLKTALRLLQFGMMKDWKIKTVTSFFI
jgi:hypothetical protein